MRNAMMLAAMTMMATAAVTMSEGDGGVKEAKASTSDVCRFRATGTMLYDGVGPYTLEFWWRRDTNAVLYTASRYSKWMSGSTHVLSPYTPSPGVVTGSDAITGAASAAAQFTVKFDSGVIGLPIILTGTLVNGGYHAATPHVLAGIYYGTSQVWVAANGVVTCGFSI